MRTDTFFETVRTAFTHSDAGNVATDGLSVNEGLTTSEAGREVEAGSPPLASLQVGRLAAGGGIGSPPPGPVAGSRVSILPPADPAPGGSWTVQDARSPSSPTARTSPPLAPPAAVQNDGPSSIRRRIAEAAARGAERWGRRSRR